MFVNVFAFSLFIYQLIHLLIHSFTSTLDNLVKTSGYRWFWTMNWRQALMRSCPHQSSSLDLATSQHYLRYLWHTKGTWKYLFAYKPAYFHTKNNTFSSLDEFLWALFIQLRTLPMDTLDPLITGCADFIRAIWWTLRLTRL